MTLELDIEKIDEKPKYYQSDRGFWAGMNAQTAQIELKKLYDIGTMSAAHYGVILNPYKLYGYNDSKLSGLPEPIPLLSQDVFKIPSLVSEVDVSILDAQSESMNIGHYQLNFITGNASNELPITFIETRNGDILKSLQRLKEMMFLKGGDQALPIDYLVEVIVYNFNRHAHDIFTFQQKYIVALQAGSTAFSASNVNGIVMVQANFLKMFPMLPFNTDHLDPILNG